MVRYYHREFTNNGKAQPLLNGRCPTNTICQLPGTSRSDAALFRLGGEVVPGERRLTSIKQLVNDMMFNTNTAISGTITIDQITGTVTVQLLEPITIDGNIGITTLPPIAISSMPALSTAITSIPALTGTFAISSIGGTLTTSTTITNNPLDIRELPISITPTTTVTALTGVSATILAANAARRYLLIRNTSSSDAAIYVRLNVGAATTTNALVLRKGEYFELPEDYIYTGAITAISQAYGSDAVTVIEGV